MVFHWSLSDSKSPQVSRTRLSALSVLNNVVVSMVSTSPPTSKSSSPFSNPFATVPNAPITIGIIVTCMFHSFFNSLTRSRYLSFFSNFSVLFCFQPGQQSRQFCKFSFFVVDYFKSGLQADIRWSVCMSKSHWNLCVLFSRTGAELCMYHLFVWSNLNFLHMVLMVSSLSPHSLHLLFCCVLSILVLILLLLLLSPLEFFTSALADGLSLEFD